MSGFEYSCAETRSIGANHSIHSRNYRWLSPWHINLLIQLSGALSKEYHITSICAMIPLAHMIQQGTPEDASVSQISNGGELNSLHYNKPVAKHSDDNNTGTVRHSQMAFATDIAQGLIHEVRKLQQTIQEKDRLIVDLEISKADSEKDKELTQKQLRQKNAIEEKLKEDNWNLEMGNQDLQSSLSELSQNVNKLNADHSKALKQLRATLEQVEVFKAQHEKATSTIDALKARHDHEQQVLRRSNGTLQRDMVQLKKRMDEVNTELKICKSKLAIKSTVNSTNIQQLLRGNNDDEHNNEDAVDSDNHGNTGTGSDILGQETTTSNTTANSQRALEVETLKQSLGHAHRMISNLRNNLQKEKVEKIELKKVLADTQEALDQLEKGVMPHESGRGSLKKNAVVNKPKVVRKRGGVARKGHSVSNPANETSSSEDRSDPLTVDTSLDMVGDCRQLVADHDNLDSGNNEISMNDSDSLHQDSTDEDDLHRLDLSPIQQGQSLDMELQLGGFNSSFKPLSFEIEETLDKRQYTDKGVNTCGDLASTLSFGRQIISHSHSSTRVIGANDVTSGNGNSRDGSIITNTDSTRDINNVSMISKSLPNASSPGAIMAQPILNLKHSPIPSSVGNTDHLQQADQHSTLNNEDMYDNANPSHDGVITPVPGSPPLDQQKSISPESVCSTVPAPHMPEYDMPCISEKTAPTTDRQEDHDQSPLSFATTTIPIINDSADDSNYTSAEASHSIDCPAPSRSNKIISFDKRLSQKSNNFEESSSTSLSIENTMNASEIVDKSQSLYAPPFQQQNVPSSHVIDEQQGVQAAAASSPSNEEQLGSDLVSTPATNEYLTRDINHASSTLDKAISVEELGHTITLEENTYPDDQDNISKDNTVTMGEIDVTSWGVNEKPNRQMDLDDEEANDIDRIANQTLTTDEIPSISDSTLQLKSATVEAYPTMDNDDSDNIDKLTTDNPNMMSREEADALIKAAIADALAKERLEAATRRQELDDNFITRSEAEAIAREKTEQAVKKERDRASTLLTKTQADSYARKYAEQTLREDQQGQQSQEPITSSFLAKAQVAAPNKASGSSINQITSRRASQTSVAPSPKPSTSTSSTATVSSSSSSSSRLSKLSGFMKIQPSVSTPAKSNRLRPSASMSSLRRTTTMSSSIHHHQQQHRPNQQKSQQQRHEDLLQPPSAPSYGSIRITETSMYSKQPSTAPPKQHNLKQPSMQSLSSARGGMAPSLFSMGDLTKQGANGDLISAITQTMIGEWMWKHTRKHVGGGISENRHKRFFWVHPYTRTLYWSTQEPGMDADEAKAKSAFIESISSIPSSDTVGASPLSLLIKTAKRDLKLTAPSLERHEIWRMSLSYLLVPPGEEPAVDDIVQVDPYHGTTGSCLTRTLSSTTDITSDACRTIPISQTNHLDDGNYQPTINGGNELENDMVNARQGCDEHDVSGAP